MICSACNNETGYDLYICKPCLIRDAQDNGGFLNVSAAFDGETIRSWKIPIENIDRFIEFNLKAKQEAEELLKAEKRSQLDPYKACYSLSSLPGQKWIVSFYKFWRAAMTNVYPKPEIRFDGGTILLMSQGELVASYYKNVIQCAEKDNNEPQLQIEVELK
jgi:hypothetical protein